MAITHDDLNWKVWGDTKNVSSDNKISAPIGAYDPSRKSSPQSADKPNTSQHEETIESQSPVSNATVSVRIRSGKLIDNGCAEFNKSCKFVVELDSKEEVKAPVKVALWGEYKGEKYNLNCEVSVHAQENIAEGEVALYYIDQFYDDCVGKGMSDAQCTYFLKVNTKGAREFIGECFTMPRDNTQKKVLCKAKIVDGLRRPVAGINVDFVCGDGCTSVESDSEGVVSFESTPDKDVNVTFSSLESIVKTMEPLWIEGIDPELKKSTDPIPYPVSVHKDSIRVTSDLITIALVPSIIRACLVGMFFETDKCFLLPSALKGIKRVKQLYDENPESKVLVVGHADTRGDDNHNMDLSLERADSMGEYLKDDVEGWYAWYGDDKSFSKRWGTREDQYMLSVLPEGKEPYYTGTVDGIGGSLTEQALKRFQEDNKCKVDGKAGPETRKALIKKYMSIDGTTLPETCELTTHGCGEHFPEVPSEMDPSWDEKKAEEKRQEYNRRVEIFFFNGAIVPAPPGKKSPRGSIEYPTWRLLAERTIDIGVDGGKTISGAVRIWLHDASGNLMGANPSSPDPVEQMLGAPYRMKINNEEVRTGYANSEGLLEEYGVPWQKVIQLDWGKIENRDEIDPVCVDPPEKEEDAENYYQYSEFIFLEDQDGTPGIVNEWLENLGYQGNLEKMRGGFQKDYGSSDDESIKEVHRSGKIRTFK